VFVFVFAVVFARFGSHDWVETEGDAVVVVAVAGEDRSKDCRGSWQAGAEISREDECRIKFMYTILLYRRCVLLGQGKCFFRF